MERRKRGGKGEREMRRVWEREREMGEWNRCAKIVSYNENELSVPTIIHNRLSKYQITALNHTHWVNFKILSSYLLFFMESFHWPFIQSFPLLFKKSPNEIKKSSVSVLCTLYYISIRIFSILKSCPYAKQLNSFHVRKWFSHFLGISN